MTKRPTPTVDSQFSMNAVLDELHDGRCGSVVHACRGKETVPPSYGRTPWPKPPAWRMRARYHRCPQSQSAPASRSATRIGLGLRAVRDEAELSEHEKSVPIPAKVLNLAISRDTHERRGNTHRLVGRRYRLGSPEGAGVRPRVNHLEDERGTLAENPLLRPLRVGKSREVCGRPSPPATTTHPEVRAVRPNSQEPVRCQRLEAVEIVGVERVEQSLGDLGAVLTVHRGIATRGLIEGTKGKRLVRSSVQTLGRSRSEEHT